MKSETIGVMVLIFLVWLTFLVGYKFGENKTMKINLEKRIEILENK